jgi:hypothetical protein
MPTFDIGDRVQFTPPFVDNIVYIVTRIQYLTENNEFTDEVTENWQYELSQVITNSVEAYLEAAP